MDRKAYPRIKSIIPAQANYWLRYPSCEKNKACYFYKRVIAFGVLIYLTAPFGWQEEILALTTSDITHGGHFVDLDALLTASHETKLIYNERDLSKVTEFVDD